VLSPPNRHRGGRADPGGTAVDVNDHGRLGGYVALAAFGDAAAAGDQHLTYVVGGEAAISALMLSRAFVAVIAPVPLVLMVFIVPGGPINSTWPFGRVVRNAYNRSLYPLVFVSR
jgi:hypothetical protein